MSFGFGFALPAYPLRGGGGNNPFNQDGPTLDMSFVDGATNVGDQLGADTYTLNTDFITPEYQVAAQYAVWENGVGLAQKTFAQIVTFSRTSGATWFNSAGVLQGVDFSVTSNTIGTGSKTFTLDATAGVNRYWTAGDTVLISDQANSANNMVGTVTSYVAATQVLVCNITSTGGSGTFTAWRVSSTMPRFDYDPATFLPRGLLIEEQRTNSIRNNTMQGAVAGTPGTPPTNWDVSPTGAATVSIGGTGTENGITYIDVSFQGVATEGLQVRFETTTQVVAADTQTWTSSFYAKIASGSVANCTLVNRTVYRTAAGAAVTITDTAFVPTTASLASQRVSAAVLAVGATIARVTNQILFSATGTVDITLRIGLPQLELGAFATSVIPTTVAQVTRNPDQASVNTLSPWYNQSAMTFYAEYAPIYTASATVPSNTPHVLQVYNTAVSTNNYGIRGAEISLSQIFVARNPTVGAQFPAVALGSYGQAGVVRKLGYAINSSDLQPAVNGALGTVLSNNVAALMATHDRMDIGSGTGGSPPYQLNGWLRRITYYPRRLSNVDLQTITT